MPSMTPDVVEEFDAYADADGCPIGESDSYLIAMVSSVEASTIVPVRQALNPDPIAHGPLSRRALLLSGKH